MNSEIKTPQTIAFEEDRRVLLRGALAIACDTLQERGIKVRTWLQHASRAGLCTVYVVGAEMRLVSVKNLSDGTMMIGSEAVAAERTALADALASAIERV